MTDASGADASGADASGTDASGSELGGEVEPQPASAVGPTSNATSMEDEVTVQIWSLVMIDHSNVLHHLRKKSAHSLAAPNLGL